MVGAKKPVRAMDHGDSTAFEALHRAERTLEGKDVSNYELVGHDAEGRRYLFRLQGRGVVMNVSDPLENRAMEMEQLLRRRLAVLGDPLSEDPRADLLALAGRWAQRRRRSGR